MKTLSLGRTPNPDIACNREIKFKTLFEYALEELGADYIATGHYAQLRWCADSDFPQLIRAMDLNKDQTYFLAGVRAEVLRHTIFPLGNLLKRTVRQIAKEANLFTANRKESFGICFIGKRNFESFIGEFLEKRPGTFITTENITLHEQQHNGAYLFTIGQSARIAGKKTRFVPRRGGKSTCRLLSNDVLGCLSMRRTLQGMWSMCVREQDIRHCSPTPYTSKVGGLHRMRLVVVRCL